MASAEVDKPLCFAIMPITTPDDALARYGGDKEHFKHVAKYIFEPAATAAGYRFVPAAVDSSRVIQAAIIKNLADAAVVLCDISLWNANVFFELGIRVALNKPVALVKDSLTEAIPFDNTPVHCYEYDHRTDPWCTEVEVPQLAEHIKAAGSHEQNELWKFAGIQVTAQQSVPDNPGDAKLDLILARLDSLEAGSGSDSDTGSGLMLSSQLRSRVANGDNRQALRSYLTRLANLRSRSRDPILIVDYDANQNLLTLATSPSSEVPVDATELAAMVFGPDVEINVGDIEVNRTTGGIDINNLKVHTRLKM